jgi:predicted small secreted protein
MKKLILSALVIGALGFTACGNDDYDDSVATI